MRLRILYFAFSVLLIDQGFALENGLARKPPMGWLSWVAFMCEVDCEKSPLTCVSENQMMAMADRIVQDGYRDLGYEFVIVDDCWLENQRDSAGRLEPDKKRFSKGMKSLAKYMHDRRLKFGIYEDYGDKTCAGYPGSKDQEAVDTATFASWDVDYVKLDGCYASIPILDYGYPAFGHQLNKTGREIVYSCEWPWWIHNYDKTAHPNYTAIRDTCNLWRNMDDIEPSWASLAKTIDFYDQNQDEFAAAQAPGAWNDPDMLAIGNAGLSVDQSRVQMALWSMWSAPLIISVDLRSLKDEFKKILQNKRVIAIDQDQLGHFGKLVKKAAVNVYTKPVTPIDTPSGDHSYALAFLNRDEKQKANYSVVLKELGLWHKKGYQVEDLFDNNPTMKLLPDDTLHTTVNPTGVTMFKATVIV